MFYPGEKRATCCQAESCFCGEKIVFKTIMSLLHDCRVSCYPIIQMAAAELQCKLRRSWLTNHHTVLNFQCLLNKLIFCNQCSAAQPRQGKGFSERCNLDKVIRPIKPVKKLMWRRADKSIVGFIQNQTDIVCLSQLKKSIDLFRWNHCASRVTRSDQQNCFSFWINQAADCLKIWLSGLLRVERGIDWFNPQCL